MVGKRIEIFRSALFKIVRFELNTSDINHFFHFFFFFFLRADFSFELYNSFPTSFVFIPIRDLSEISRGEGVGILNLGSEMW